MEMTRTDWLCVAAFVIAVILGCVSVVSGDMLSGAGLIFLGLVALWLMALRFTHARRSK